MMLLGSHYHRRPFPATVSQPVHSTPVRLSSSVFEKHEVSSQSSFPTWITQALCDLSQGEQELQHLREWQTAEVDKVNEGLDSAIIGAQKEERFLLERVEQIHRETQQKIQQLKRENVAAARVGQSLVDRQLRKIGHLREKIHMWGRYPSGPNKSQLVRDVRELIQPWEMSISLKNVIFQSSPHPKTIPFGEIVVQENNLNFPVGVCGPQGQKCAIHSGELAHENHVAVSEQLHAPCNGPVGRMDKESSKSNTGSARIVRKIRISTTEENALGKDEKLPSPKPRKLLTCKQDNSESSQDEELESPGSDTRGDDLFLAIHPVSSQGESEDAQGIEQHGVKRHSLSRGYRNQKTLVPVSSKEPSCPPEENGPKYYEGSQGFQRGMSNYTYENVTPAKSEYKGRPSSPADSVDSSYTFTVKSASSHNGPTKGESRRSISTADLSTRGRPLINAKGEQRRRKMNRSSLSPPCTTSEQGPKGSETCKSKDKSPAASSEASGRICRSFSMSAIEGKTIQQTRFEQNKDRRSTERPDLGLFTVEEARSTVKVGHLVKKIGKQGSGRTDFTLPSGVHATPQGQLFVVDCGNVRVQVTDLQRNIVQQITPPACEGTSRHCRNFFDVAANSKGLIALTCAAERALLVFSRHGRLLQTYGGSGSAGPQDLEAPRGVTVTRLDEFLVVDIRRGTLTALKLDPKTGARMERTVVTGFHRPYLVAACLTSGLMAVSERGNETGRAPCIKVLEPGWNTIRVLGVCSGMGPVLSSPWGICIDADGDVLVADWGKQHCIVLYPAVGVGRSVVTHGLSSPRGLALLPENHLVISDSMNHCIKIYRYK